MTDEELAELLSNACVEAPRDQKTNTYVMFGIRYADELRGRAGRVVNIARRQHHEARVSRSAGTDIGYGIRLAPYVTLNQPLPFWFVQAGIVA